jgi:hypothetical protein
MTMDDGIIEQEIQRKGLTAPRVTPQDLEDNIIGEHYQAFASTTTTVCCLILRNGFTAREDAKRKIWPLMGYALREMLATEPKTAKDRAVVERDQLAERLGKLDGFIGTSNYLALPSETQALLSSQRQYMGGYLAALEQRLAAWD